MDLYTEILNQQRHLEPPPGAVDQLERQVMARLERLPGERRRRRLTVAAATLFGALFLVLLVVSRPRSPRAPTPAFVESVVILNDHVCIWLEVPSAGTGSKNVHD